MPFSWSQMLVATGQSFDEVVGVGVVAVKVFARPYSYDEKRAVAYGLQQGGQHPVFPPIWDFLTSWSCGLTALASYCIRDGGGRRASRYCRLHNARHDVLPTPAGPRRCRHYQGYQATPTSPSQATPSSPSCLRCFSGCPRRCRSRPRHLRLRGRAMHIAAHRRVSTTRCCRGLRLRYLRLRGML